MNNRWSELSTNRLYARRDELNIENNDYEEDDILSYGLLENLTMLNCMSVEDVYSNVIWEN
jgi:hypothetical protein